VFNGWVERSLDKLADLMPGRYAKFEISPGFLGSLEIYAYRAPGAPEPQQDEPEPGVPQPDAPASELPGDQGEDSEALPAEDAPDEAVTEELQGEVVAAR
jgi:hypothetical protein